MAHAKAEREAAEAKAKAEKEALEAELKKKKAQEGKETFFCKLSLGH